MTTLVGTLPTQRPVAAGTQIYAASTRRIVSGAHAPDNRLMSKPVRCLLQLHAWVTHHNVEGRPFQLCRRCDAYREKLTRTDSAGFS